MTDPLRLGISPCPNDTFVFAALAHGRVPGAPPVEVVFADIEECNRSALAGGLDVVKVSYGALPWLLDRYELLRCGGALGRGCGPLVVGRSDNDQLGGLSGATVAVPGERTTAYLLLRLWAQACLPGGLGEIRQMPFDRILAAVRDGAADLGLVIHESRFTYPSYGLEERVDLGRWWEDEAGLPIPLGAVVVRRDLDEGVKRDLAGWVRRSVRAAEADPAAVRDYVMAHSAEMDPQVADAHIALYVTEFTYDLGAEGVRAVDALLGRAAAAGLVPAVPPLGSAPESTQR